MPVIVYVNGDDIPKRFNGDPAQVKNVLDQKYSQIRRFSAVAGGDIKSVISMANERLTDPDNRKVFANLLMKSNP